MTAALDLYAAGLDGAELHLRDAGGTVRRVALDLWLGPLTDADDGALSRARGPVLDIGCGPGRHVLALAGRGVMALGVDVSPAAVRLARDRGASVLHGSIFEQVPGAGTWGSALLLDGNVGIGGDAVALLTRVRSLLRPDGRAIVEVDPPGSPTTSRPVRLEGRAAASDWFAWATVGADAVDQIGARAGLRADELWQHDGRWFACLTKEGA